MKLGLWAALLLWTVGAARAAPGPELTAGPGRVHLVELFTSEGCSSCPPADRRLAGLEDDPGLWSRFVPVELHVDYWDALGWRDPFSRREFTARQRAYARRWGTSSVYTPCFVVDGREWTRWREAGKIPASESDRPGVLSVHQSGPLEFQIRFAPTHAPRASLRFAAAYLLMELTSDVRKGENQDRTLSHRFVAVGYREGRLKPSESGYSGTARFKQVQSRWSAGPAGIAVWVMEGDDPAPIQAVGGKLPEARR